MFIEVLQFMVGVISLPCLSDYHRGCGRTCLKVVYKLWKSFTFSHIADAPIQSDVEQKLMSLEILIRPGRPYPRSYRKYLATSLTVDS